MVTPVKIVVVGDADSGKTVLLITYTKNEYPEEYVPTVFENYCSTIVVDGKPHLVGLWDTAGQEDFDHLRPNSYPGTDTFLLLFSIASRRGFESIRSKWHPEVLHYTPNAKCIIVGTMIDLRESLTSKNQNPVTFEQGEQLAREIHAHAYMECSALAQVGVKEVFEDAIRLGGASSSSTSKFKRILAPVEMLCTLKWFQDRPAVPAFTSSTPALVPPHSSAQPPPVQYQRRHSSSNPQLPQLPLASPPSMPQVVVNSPPSSFQLPPRPPPPSISFAATKGDKVLPLTQMENFNFASTDVDIGCWTFNISSSGDRIAANWGDPVEYVIITSHVLQDKCFVRLTNYEAYCKKDTRSVQIFEVNAHSVIAAGDSCRYFILCKRLGLGFLTAEDSQNFLMTLLNRVYQARNYRGSISLKPEPEPESIPPMRRAGSDTVVKTKASSFSTAPQAHIPPATGNSSLPALQYAVASAPTSPISSSAPPPPSERERSKKGKRGSKAKGQLLNRNEALYACDGAVFVPAEGEKSFARLMVMPDGAYVFSSGSGPQVRPYPWSSSMDISLTTDNHLKVILAGGEGRLFLTNNDAPYVLDLIENTVAALFDSYHVKCISARYGELNKELDTLTLQLNSVRKKCTECRSSLSNLDTQQRGAARVRDYDAAERIKQQKKLVETQLNEIAAVEHTLHMKAEELISQMEKLWQKLIDAREIIASKVRLLRQQEEECAEREDYQQAKSLYEGGMQTEAELTKADSFIKGLANPESLRNRFSIADASSPPH
eukprot:TRINITY_DN2610_c0_g1_i1.p1 TRINITY_DN2610_c0_g1~~TRINITY_DN2610_c0_g1_i1.p1  ORF type:complete len:773 (-),score=177.84 TRINITY_DN2610_c0_g1_i1:26-2344(-)